MAFSSIAVEYTFVLNAKACVPVSVLERCIFLNMMKIVVIPSHSAGTVNYPLLVV